MHSIVRKLYRSTRKYKHRPYVHRPPTKCLDGTPALFIILHTIKPHRRYVNQKSIGTYVQVRSPSSFHQQLLEAIWWAIIPTVRQHDLRIYGSVAYFPVAASPSLPPVLSFSMSGYSLPDAPRRTW